MDLNELREFIGTERVVNWPSSEGGLDVHVNIVSAEVRWGHNWLLCSPVAGEGERWFSLDVVKK